MREIRNEKQMSVAILERHLESYGLALVSDPHKHRKVVALELLKKGSVVITSRPLCNPIIFPTHRSQHCETCFRSRNPSTSSTTQQQQQKKVVDLERCSVCKTRYYCDKNCFATAWKGWHKCICPIKRESYDLDHEMLQMVIMSIERIQCGSITESEENNIKRHLDTIKGSRGEQESLELTAFVFSTLMGHESVSDPSTLLKYKEIATQIRSELLASKFVFKSEISRNRKEGSEANGYGAPPPISELIQYLCRFHCNNFSIHDSQLFTMAEGTFPIGALFNHSCRPNAIVMYEGQVQVVIALEDIEPGQEVCTSYVDNGVQRAERRQLLREKYFFDCLCPRCIEVEEDPVNVDNDQKINISKKKKTGFQILDDLIEGDQDGQEGKKVDGEWLTKQFETIILPSARSLQTPGPSLQPPSIFTRASFTSHIIHSLVPLIQTHASSEIYTKRLFEIYKVLSETPHCDPKPFTTTVMTNATSFFNTCLEHQSWTLASKIGTFILALYLMIYPRHHPLVGLHCFTLAKSLWNDVEGGMTSVRLSYEILTLAKNILVVSHGTKGENSTIVREVKEFMKTVETELVD